MKYYTFSLEKDAVIYVYADQRSGHWLIKAIDGHWLQGWDQTTIVPYQILSITHLTLTLTTSLAQHTIARY
jgi:hypothetical protein